MSSPPNAPSPSTPTSWDKGDYFIKKRLENKPLLIAPCDDPQNTEEISNYFWPDTEFLRKNQDFSDLPPTFHGYVRWEESKLAAEFDKFQLSHEDETQLRTMVKRMKEDKVQPKNVVCIALGSLHDCNDWEREKSFGKMMALLKFIELLGKHAITLHNMQTKDIYRLTRGLDVPKNARKVIQDPFLTPGDERFLKKYGFQVEEDPNDANAINRETLLFYLDGTASRYKRFMNDHQPVILITNGKMKVGMGEGKVGMGEGKDEESANKIRLYDSQEIPSIGKGEGMKETKLYWRKDLSKNEVTEDRNDGADPVSGSST
ncbi:hypothetical protein NHQ30_007700 [Ciborinia camelliae]|nr:hypothetical protein NHQ30_007700 [Ciborinia camelliae]